MSAHLVRVEVLQLQPGAGRHLGRDVGLVGVVGLVEAEDDVVVVCHGVIDVIMPGSVVLNVPPHHGDESLARGRGAAGVGAGAVILYRLHLMVGSDVPVVPPTATHHPLISHWLLVIIDFNDFNDLNDPTD